MSTELKPCPFCGIQPKAVGVFGMAGAEHPMDNDCYFRGAIWPADKWNRRPVEPVPAPVGLDLRDQIETALREYRCQYTLEADTNDGLALVDVLSPEETVKEGLEEIHLLADHLAASLFPRPATGADQGGAA